MTRFANIAVWMLAVLASAPCMAGEAKPVDGSPTVKASIDNPELQAIVDADQADRLGGAWLKDAEAVMARDRARRDRVLALLRGGRLGSARDYFNAALVFQHSDGDVPLAYALATVSHYLDPGHKAPPSLMAAAWDRMLMRRVQPQWYGTQYQTDERGTFLFPVAEGAVTDQERAAMSVPSLAEARARTAEVAASVGKKPAATPTIGELQARTRSTAQKPAVRGDGK